MIRRLEEQHLRFLAEVKDATVRTLQEENRRLSDQLSLRRDSIDVETSDMGVATRSTRSFSPAGMHRETVSPWKANKSEAALNRPSRADGLGANIVKESKRLRALIGLGSNSTVL